jgi:hypothetical protein
VATPSLAIERPTPDAHLETRVSATQESIKRARFALFLNVLAAGAVIVCLWNTYISSDRDFAFQPLPYPTPRQPAPSGQTTVSTDPGHPDFGLDTHETYRQLLQQQFKGWVDSQYVSVNLLGIRISVSDFGVLAALGLDFFLFYYLLCVRRENREVGQLFRDFYRAALSGDGQFEVDRLHPAAYATYSAVSSYLIFNLNRRDDAPIRSVDAFPKHQKLFGIRAVSHIMIYASLIAITAIIICDRMSDRKAASSTFFETAFRLDPNLNNVAPDRRMYFSVVEWAAVAFGFWAAYMTWQIRRYQEATRDVFESFRRYLVKANYLE